MKDLNTKRISQLSFDLDDCLLRYSELDDEMIDVRNYPDSSEYRVLIHRMNMVRSNINLIAKELYQLSESIEIYSSIDE